MVDIQKAKEHFKSGEYTCVLCKGDVVYTSVEKGVLPMICFIEQGKDLSGFSAADKIVGKAAAMLFVYAEVSEVYAEVMSTASIEVLKNNNISFSYGTLTEKIINRKGMGICPMEQAVSGIDQPKEALAAIKNKLKDLQKGA